MKLSDEFFEKCNLVLLQRNTNFGICYYGFNDLPMPSWILAVCDDSSELRMITKIRLDCKFLRIDTNDVFFISADDGYGEEALANDIKKIYKRYLLLTKQLKQEKIKLKLSEAECDFK